MGGVWRRNYMELNSQLNVPGSFTPGKTATGNYLIGRRVSPRAGLKAVEWKKIAPHGK
jgi:hypothetical protein